MTGGFQLYHLAFFALSSGDTLTDIFQFMVSVLTAGSQPLLYSKEYHSD